MLESKAVLINLCAQEAEKGLRWDGVVVVAVCRPFLLGSLDQLSLYRIKEPK